jgi:hypothetical protein
MASFSRPDIRHSVTVRVMIGHRPDALPPAQTGDHNYFDYLHFHDVDALHAEFLAARRDHTAAVDRQALGDARDSDRNS